MDPRIRPRQQSDMPALIKVLNSTWQTDSYPVQGPSEAGTFISPPESENAWVALDERGRAVGQIVLESAALIYKHDLVLGHSGHRALLQAWLDLGHEISETTIAARFFVRKDMRGEGLGKALVEVAVEWAKARGMRVVLNVLEVAPGAVRLYESMGFEKYGEAMYGGGPRPVKQYFYAK